MDKSAWTELLLVLASLALHVGYHIFLFWLRDPVFALIARLSHRHRRRPRAIVTTASSDARLAWTVVISRDKTDASVPAVQCLRNSIMAASFMATTCGLMATSGLLPVLTDGNRLAEIRKLGDLDPIVDLAGSRGMFAGQVAWKIAICEIILLFSLLFLVQAIRLWAFLAFFIRLQAAEEPIRSHFSMDLTLAVARRAGHCWTAGVRIFYMFPSALLWVMGPTTCFCVTCVVVSFLAVTDSLRIHPGEAIAIAGHTEEGKKTSAVAEVPDGRHDAAVDIAAGGTSTRSSAHHEFRPKPAAAGQTASGQAVL